MTETMGVRVEVWPVAADPIGIWLVSEERDAWRSDLVPADSEPHREVQRLLREHHEVGDGWLLHSTSWRVDDDTVILTYIAVLGSHGHAGMRYGHGNKPANLHGEYTFVHDIWPDAHPITLKLHKVVGKPPQHRATEAPAPRYIDVLMHAVRHLRFLLETDTSAQAALDDNWRMHLGDLRPSLAGMYQHVLGG